MSSKQACNLFGTDSSIFSREFGTKKNEDHAHRYLHEEGIKRNKDCLFFFLSNESAFKRDARKMDENVKIIERKRKMIRRRTISKKYEKKDRDETYSR